MTFKHSSATRTGKTGAAAVIERLVSVAAEAARAAAAVPIASLLIVAVLAGTCAAVILTAGRSVGAEQAVLKTIDSAGTRTITVRAERNAELRGAFLDRVNSVTGVSWSAGFGFPVDATNDAISGGERVALRDAWLSDWSGVLHEKPLSEELRVAYGSPNALQTLGVREFPGRLITTTGAGYAVSEIAEVPESLNGLEPLLLHPVNAPDEQLLSVVVIVVDRVQIVSAVREVIESLVPTPDPAAISIETSDQLVQLRNVVQGQLGTFGRTITLGILGVASGLVAIILFSSITSRRRDFGRRRALGATRRLVVSLVLIQTLMLAAIGTISGALLAGLTLAITGDPVPSNAYMISIAVLATNISLLSAVAPAIYASRRDPIVELRVP